MYARSAYEPTLSGRRFCIRGAPENEIRRHFGSLGMDAVLAGGGVMTSDIDERAFSFFCDVIRFVRTIQPRPGMWRLADQMVAASGSIAANREEASSASTRKEFIRFNEIALRSAKEASLWLRACATTQIGDRRMAAALFDEGRHIARILASIVISSKTRSQRSSASSASRVGPRVTSGF